MNISKKIVLTFISVVLLIGFAGCGGGEKELDLTPQERALMQTVFTDDYGRTPSVCGEEIKDKYIGMFYFTWLGQHQGGGQSLPYDISKLLENDPDKLWDPNPNAQSPIGSYHFWGEPLWGYYNSCDPWVITRQIEMLSAAGVDFLVFDATNAVSYDEPYKAVLKVLDQFQKQGFKTPRVTFYTNSSSARTVTHIYNTFYADTAPAANRYPGLWFAPGGKPMMIGDIWSFTEEDTPQQMSSEKVRQFFDFRQSQWPDKLNNKLGFPWMSFEYEQFNHNGVMSVSIAQHTSTKMSGQAAGNRGRGFDFSTMSVSKDFRKGDNYEGQWQAALKGDVHTAFITGWNEWVAIKFKDSANNVYFVDTFNEEYSRDIEPMKGGYGDNFFLQTIINARKFKFKPVEKVKYARHTVDIDNLSSWDGVNTVYRDFNGDAVARDFIGYTPTMTYTDNTNRNDIVSVAVTHDKEYLYVKAETAADITEYAANDLHWMNLWLSTENMERQRFNGSDFVINRKPSGGKTSIEKCTGGYNFVQSGEAEISVSGKAVVYKIKLSELELSGDVKIGVRVSDNVFNAADAKFDTQDHMNYYQYGDSAPIGRLHYAYGY